MELPTRKATNWTLEELDPRVFRVGNGGMGRAAGRSCHIAVLSLVGISGLP